MHRFLAGVESFFSSLSGKLASLFSRGEEHTENQPKKVDIFDRADAYFQKFDGSFLVWSFFLSTAVMLLIYAFFGVYPFGKNSVLVLDLNGQYVQFFAGLRRILHGDGSLLYSFSRSLGGEFLGIYAYYLASPLSYLVALFPAGSILEALLCILVLKTGLSGLFFGVYLHYTRRPHKTVTVALSVLYALSAYSVVMQHNLMWMDGLMLLPLLILGLHRLIRQKKPVLYTVSLALILLCNYYIGYMICLFTAIYFFYDFAAHPASVTNPTEERRHFLSTLGRCALFTLLGVGMAALLLLPAYYSLTFGKNAFSSPDFSFKAKFDILDFLAKLFPGAYDTVRPNGLPWVYSGVLSLLLVPLYFVDGKIPWRKKVATGCFLLLLFLSMYLNPLDILWHGGQAPNWLNYRYSFAFCFLALTCAADVTPHLRQIGHRAILVTGGCVAALAVLLQKLGLTYTASDGEAKEFFDDLNGLWLTLGCVVLYVFLLLLLSEHGKEDRQVEPIAMVMTLIVCIETFLNGSFYLRRLNEDVVVSSYASYHDFYDRYADAFDYVKENDPSLYRMEKSFQRNVCDPFVFGYRGVASSTSTLNTSTIAFVSQMGLKANSHWTEATGLTPASGSLLGVKYWVCKDGEKADPIYRVFHRNGDAETGNQTVTYENPYALPLVFCSSRKIKDVSFALPEPGDYVLSSSGKYVLPADHAPVCLSPFQRVNSVFGALLGQDSPAGIYTPLAVTSETTGGLKRTDGQGWVLFHTDNEGSSSARLDFTFTAPESGAPVYCYFPSQYPREAVLYLNGEPFEGGKKIYPENARQAETICLGSFPAGERVTVSLTELKSGDLYLIPDTPYFYTIDESALREASVALQAGGLVCTRLSDDRMEGTLTAPETMAAVQTTIPYDEGWQITVDGVRVTPYPTVDALLAFDLPGAGTHTISLRYWPGCYTVGVAVSLFSFLLFLGIVILLILRKRTAAKERVKESAEREKNAFSSFCDWLLPAAGVGDSTPEGQADKTEESRVNDAGTEAARDRQLPSSHAKRSRAGRMTLREKEPPQKNSKKTEKKQAAGAYPERIHRKKKKKKKKMGH